jgi:hypothetical protein
MGFLGLVAAIVGAIGIVLRVRAGRRPTLSIIGAALGILLVLPSLWLLVSPSV